MAARMACAAGSSGPIFGRVSSLPRLTLTLVITGMVPRTWGGPPRGPAAIGTGLFPGPRPSRVVHDLRSRYRRTHALTSDRAARSGSGGRSRPERGLAASGRFRGDQLGRGPTMTPRVSAAKNPAKSLGTAVLACELEIAPPGAVDLVGGGFEPVVPPELEATKLWLIAPGRTGSGAAGFWNGGGGGGGGGENHRGGAPPPGGGVGRGRGGGGGSGGGGGGAAGGGGGAA